MGQTAKYYLINRSTSNIQLILPTPCGRDACVTLPMSNSIDILPIVGNIDACRRILFVHRLRDIGSIEIEEQ